MPRGWVEDSFDDRGVPPSVGRAIARYALAWHLWLPGLAWVSLLHSNALADLGALAAGFIALLLPALADPQRRLLHDRWTRTRVVHVDA